MAGRHYPPNPEGEDMSDQGHSSGESQGTGTLWSVVLAAGSTDSVVAKPALQQLCTIYWYPMYAFVRRQGYSAADSEDLTQGFFAGLLARNGFQGLDRSRGRFRSFLLASLRNHISNVRVHQHAQKRGGGQDVFSLDAAAAEERYAHEPADPSATPEKLFDRQWALTLLGRALARLREEYLAAGRGELFDALQDTLAGDRVDGGYQAVGGRLGMAEGAVKVAAHRLRNRYREVIREEVAATTAGASETEDELHELFAALER